MLSRRLLNRDEHCSHLSGLRVRSGSPEAARQLEVSSSSTQLEKSAGQHNSKHQHMKLVGFFFFFSCLHDPTTMLSTTMKTCSRLSDLHRLQIVISLIRWISLLDVSVESVALCVSAVLSDGDFISAAGREGGFPPPACSTHKKKTETSSEISSSVERKTGSSHVCFWFGVKTTTGKK